MRLKSLLKIFLIGILVICVGAAFVLWLGSFASLDHERQHSRDIATLPLFDPSQPGSASAGAASSAQVRIEARGMTFHARVAGLGGKAGNVILLHGFPESAVMWKPLQALLAGSGYQVLAFDQRGYSPGARPEDPAAYTITELVSDVYALADAVGFDRFHLVGHDWGAAVGWSLVLQDDSRVDTWTALSIPHLGAYRDAMATDPDQRARSGYIGFFRTPWLPEVLFTFNRLRLLESIYADHADAEKAEYLRLFAEPGALTAALNWYRASDLTAENNRRPELEVPVLFVWGRDDPVVGQRALETQRQYLRGPHRELELDTGHWLMQAEPAAVSAAVLSHIQAHPPEPPAPPIGRGQLY